MMVSIAAMAMLFVGCSSMMSLSTYGPNDLYRTNNRAEVAAQLKAEAEAELLAAEARRAQYEARIAQANADFAEAEYYAMVNNEPSFTSVVADDFQSAYARRLYGFQSPTYNLPSSYYNMLNSSSIYYVTAYDPAYYNIMVSGDQVWVEPKYVTSMFGSWGATNVTFGLYASPWNYGWSYHVDPFYYSMWGYPRYSWYDWNWAMCYNPFYYDWYWGGYYDPFYPHYHHHHHYYPGYYPMPPRPGYGPGHGPDHRPGYSPTTGSGASMGPGNLNGSRGNTGSRYTSPVTNRNYGGSDNRVSSGRPTSGSTSQGFNSNSVRPSSGSSSSSRNNSAGGTRITNGTSAGSSSNFRQGSSTTTSSRGTSTTVTNTNRGSSSNNNRVGTSQTGNYRQGSSSSSSSSRSSGSSSSSSYRQSSSSSSSRSSSYGGSSGSSSRSGSGSSGSFRSGGSSSGGSRR